MKKYIIAILLIVAVSLGITYKYINSKEVKVNKNSIELSENKRKELNNYFTLFVKYKLEDFKENSLTDENAINFAVAYNFDNNFEKFSVYQEKCCAYIEQKYIEDTINEFFAKKVEKHLTTPKYEFIDNKYIAPLASGGSYNFAKVKEMVEEDGKVTAYLDIYHADGSFIGDINDTEEEWAKGEGEVPELIGKKKALMKDGKVLSFENY
ncbi:hypothetical protein KQI86_06650 [Clostridium sp. MSJ-11]|uniref:Uncharacterized protein n=1 Tax=Clostridium mobile TaxID=2841512 RepID=A0ABS6EFN3_9CLOT|nr:hypothetical protein [Clostridium mobile]MBU5484004.1 hypothetical protein [Clostridium mobile]